MITYNGHSTRLFPKVTHAYELILITQQDSTETLDRAQNLANQLNMQITALAPRADAGFGMDYWTVTPDSTQEQ